jgi:radical SAM superfamily enzyme YgiQ (UPF0313 family)
MVNKRSITWNEMEKGRKRLDEENGTIIKDWGGKLPFAFVYPNSYFIGMSNLGLQAIYGLLNNREDVVCERIFWDKENIQAVDLPLSVESQRPPSDFAVLAFSLNYELDYLNIAPLLKASGIPLYSVDRDETQPLIIAGGPCITANPMPVAPFFDCLCIGEAEALLPEMIPQIINRISDNRADLLNALSKIPGIYVPNFNPNTPVIRQWVKHLDDFPVNSIVLTQDTELSDLHLIEVERGCAHGCRFCLVNSAFSPMRFHSADQIIEQAEMGLNFRKRIGLVGPSVTDHPQIELIFSKLLEMGAQFSISSLRITSLTGGLLAQMIQGGLRSIALAPESGSECMRQLIKKGITEYQILEAIRQAVENKMQQLKLYFMIGLPQETDEDVNAIVVLTLKGKDIIDKKKGKTRLTLNISPFVPKAGTPFQLMPMEQLNIMQQRMGLIKNKLAHKGIKVNSESPPWTEIQAVLSRGDSSLAKVLEQVDHVSLPTWRSATEKACIDLDYFAHEKWDTNCVLPWSIIKSSLIHQRQINS